MPDSAFQFICDGDRAALLVPDDTVGAIYIMEHAIIKSVTMSHTVDMQELYSTSGYTYQVPGLAMAELDLSLCAGSITRSTGPQALIDFGLVRNMTVRQLLAEIDRRLKKR